MAHRFLKADLDITNLTKTAERTINGIRRYYYAGAGAHRILIVMRNGEPLEALAAPNIYVKALVGWDEGSADFVLPEHAGKQHTKITVDMVLVLTPEQAQEWATTAGLKVESMAQILANAPRSDRAGGARGEVGRKPVGGTERARPGSVSLLPDQWALAERLGDGVASVGIRRALDAWRDEQP
jgi:hypothetical protein